MTEPVRKKEDKMSCKPLLAFLALATVMLVGCHEPAGVANDVHAATTVTLYVTTDNFMLPCGHIDWYQGELAIWDGYSYNPYDSTIRRAFNYYPNPTNPPTYDTMRAYPRKNGHCVFRIPGFDANGLPACTLFYYQSAHIGSADLVVKTFLPKDHWPPLYMIPDFQEDFWREWNSTDTVATDSTRTSDGYWYKVPLTDWACQAIADSGAEYYGTENWANFYTGWIYPSYNPSHGASGSYTDVSGSSGYAPYIKVVYED
jgi:hypothetical protein